MRLRTLAQPKCAPYPNCPQFASAHNAPLRASHYDGQTTPPCVTATTGGHQLPLIVTSHLIDSSTLPDICNSQCSPPIVATVLDNPAVCGSAPTGGRQFLMINERHLLLIAMNPPPGSFLTVQPIRGFNHEQARNCSKGALCRQYRERQGVLVVCLWREQIATILRWFTQGYGIYADEIHRNRNEGRLLLRVQANEERPFLRWHTQVAVVQSKPCRDLE